MADEDESGEKSFDASQKKLDDARAKGEFPKSVDLTTAAAYGGFVLAAVAFGGESIGEFGARLADLIEHPDTLSEHWFRGSASALTAELLFGFSKPLLVWFGLPAAMALLAIIAQRAFVVAPDKLQPKLNRLSLLSNAKNKFGRSGLFEFFKSFVKLAVYGLVLGLFLLRQMPEIVATAQFGPAIALMTLTRLSIAFLTIVLVISLVIGGLDFVWQKQEHARKNMMTRKEVTDEHKQSEGDPHVKQQRRQRGYDIAMNKMLSDVPDASVIVVNPEHYAVALKWDKTSLGAPVCVAKGVDEVAARIRQTAAEAGVPIHRDPPTARALFASVEVGCEIEPSQYRAVAAAIRFAEAMRVRASKRR